MRKRDGLSVTAAGVAVGFWLAATAGMSAAASAAEPPRGLVLYFSFDHPDAGGLVADRSGQNHNGHASGARWNSAGKQGGGCLLSPGDSSIHVAGSRSSNVKQATFAVWFKTSRSDEIWRRILERRAGQGYAMGIGGGAMGQESRGKLAFSASGGKPCLSDSVVADGAWHHGAVTFDGENLRMYVDGQPQKQVIPCRAEIAAIADDLTIGMNRSRPSPREKGQSFDGMIDELMIFNRVLSAEEIKAMVSAVDPRAVKPKFTKQQVAGRLRQLRLLFEEGLLTEDFYARKVAECEVAQ